MKFELDGKTYYTETKMVCKTRLLTTGDNGEKFVCVFTGIPFDASESQIKEYMLEHGARVVE